MTVGKIFGVLVVLSFAAAGSAMARDKNKDTAAVKGKPAISIKGEKAADKIGQAPVAARHVNPQAPIVMGRSVSVRRNTKLHYVKVKPLDSAETPLSASNTP